MKLKPRELSTHLRSGLLPIYIVSGQEPLQRSEAVQMIRKAGEAAGFSERLVLDADPGFDWDRLRSCAATLSLFSEKRLIDVRLRDAKPGRSGAAELARYAEKPPADTLLLVDAGKADRSATGSAWFKSLERAGGWVQIWPLGAGEVEAWIASRLKARGLRADREAVGLLAAKVEGNLLAARQEIEKLDLLLGGGAVDAATLSTAIADSARFTVFDLADALVAGDAQRAARIVVTLRDEGVAPPLVLWSISDQVRQLYLMAYRLGRGAALQEVTRSVRQSRRPQVSRALGRHSEPHWRGLLQHCSRVDRVIKGVERGNEWEDLLELAVVVCGETPVIPDPGVNTVSRMES